MLRQIARMQNAGMPKRRQPGGPGDHMTRILIALAAVLSMAAHAYDGPIEKKTFALPAYTTVGGKALKDVKVGFETYGKLNAAATMRSSFRTSSAAPRTRRARMRRPTRRPATGTRSSAPVGRSTPTSSSSSAPMRSPTSTSRIRGSSRPDLRASTRARASRTA
jgi:LmbE family N-acetylglucosaminyl deacetylase